MFGFWKRQPSVTLTAGPATAPTRSFAAPHHRFAPPAYRKKFGTDYVGLVGFNDSAFVIARPAEVYAAWLQQRAMTLHERVGGHTNIADGLRKANEMLTYAPPGALKRIYLLTDGIPDREVGQIMPMVEQARRAYTNINTIGVGDPEQFDRALLERVAAATHNGRFVSVQSLRELTDALIAGGNGTTNMRSHRSETAVIVCDCSGSMAHLMDGKSKIAVVEESLLRLLAYKQRMFA
jgi:Mg-chelatase subunit ChlD